VIANLRPANDSDSAQHNFRCEIRSAVEC
jgi:hypothetical protein